MPFKHLTDYKLILTSDGSHTLQVPELNEHYHSTFGALSESEHIFMKNGLYLCKGAKVSVLEAGFGTGLNALLAILRAEKNGQDIVYHSIESSPLPEYIWTQLNYPSIIKEQKAEEYFRKIHKADWDTEVSITPFFHLKKLHTDLPLFIPEERKYDLVLFDAFGPAVQPELWTEAIFLKMHTALKPGGFLITYSVKGSVKRALKAAGFTIEKLPGPAGKREILRAVPSTGCLR